LLLYLNDINNDDLTSDIFPDDIPRKVDFSFANIDLVSKYGKQIPSDENIYYNANDYKIYQSYNYIAWLITMLGAIAVVGLTYLLFYHKHLVRYLKNKRYCSNEVKQDDLYANTIFDKAENRTVTYQKEIYTNNNVENGITTSQQANDTTTINNNDKEEAYKEE
jgi:hypothetical protein